MTRRPASMSSVAATRPARPAPTMITSASLLMINSIIGKQNCDDSRLKAKISLGAQMVVGKDLHARHFQSEHASCVFSQERSCMHVLHRVYGMALLKNCQLF